MSRPTAFSRRDYATILAFGAVWMYGLAGAARSAYAFPRYWYEALALFLVVSATSWAGLTYRRVTLYLMPALLMLCLSVIALALLGPGASDPGRMVFAAAIFALPTATVLWKRHHYASGRGQAPGVNQPEACAEARPRAEQ
jgi:hypothetical protein